ncbi:hypothetical protein [uncultured Bifidobacterium sp.]|uniref:hypothetical protein n=1 Tax=uncultured Bifidobacterium sp. TaxID=165187 RepID=UPI002625CD00|nr:hypothetical protein [uncultured Bifidobacterium sp.]
MTYIIHTKTGRTETYGSIDDAGDRAFTLADQTGHTVKVFNQQTGLVTFTVHPTTEETA